MFNSLVHFQDVANLGNKRLVVIPISGKLSIEYQKYLSAADNYVMTLLFKNIQSGSTSFGCDNVRMPTVLIFFNHQYLQTF